MHAGIINKYGSSKGSWLYLHVLDECFEFPTAFTFISLCYGEKQSGFLTLEIIAKQRLRCLVACSQRTKNHCGFSFGFIQGCRGETLSRTACLLVLAG